MGALNGTVYTEFDSLIGETHTRILKKGPLCVL
jgi:hypothetical protein